MIPARKLLRTALTALAAAASLACGSGGGAGGPDDPPSAARTTPLWEPMDSFDGAVWQKADWTNGAMFNCGWKPDHATLSGGRLTLLLDDVASHGRPYSSAEYRTWDTFRYGTFETSMIAARGRGLVSSFFLYTGSPWDEIDVEILGKDTTQVQFNYYVNGVGGHEKLVPLGFDAAAGFHAYAIAWGPGRISWYVDGVLKWAVDDAGLNAPSGAAMPSHPMQIMMNLWPGTGVDDWLGAFGYTAPLQAQYEYVRFTPP